MKRLLLIGTIFLLLTGLSWGQGTITYPPPVPRYPNSLAAKVTPVGADLFLVWDSEASPANTPKKITVTNLLAYLNGALTAQVNLQATTPGTEQVGNTNISGKSISSSSQVWDPTVLGSESLAENNFATNVKWTEAGGFAFAGQKAVYTHAGGTGSITQTSANMAVAGVGTRYYKFVYTVSSVTAGCTATITTGIAASAQTLTLTAGTQTLYFQSAASPGNFVISVTSTAGGFSLDDLSLKEVQGGTIIGGTAYLYDLILDGHTSGAIGLPYQFACGVFNPLDNTTYYIGGRAGAVAGTASGRRRIYFQTPGIVKRVRICFDQTIAGPVTGETSSVSIRINDTTSYLVTDAVENASANTVTYANTSLNIPVVAGDFFEIVWVTPNPGWATNPTNVEIWGMVLTQ